MALTDKAFQASFLRYQAEQAVPIDRLAKLTSVVLWASAVCKQVAYGFLWQAALGLSCILLCAALLAASYWRRSAYVAHARWLIAAQLVWSHAVAAAICVSSHQLTPGRHSSNALRFMFIQMIHNVGLFQALAAHNSWPMLGMRFLLPVQLVSMAVMAPRLRAACQAALVADEGAARMFASANWLLRQVFCVVDAGPPGGPSSQAVHEIECLQVNLWWLFVCGAGATYTCWLREQRARERFARQLGAAGDPHLRRMLRRHPLESHQRPALLMAIELFTMAALIWEGLRVVLPGSLAGTALLGAANAGNSDAAAAAPAAAAHRAEL